MNKKEQAEMGQLRKELALARSLHFTEVVKPDVMPPTSFEMPLSKGFTFNSYGVSVSPACSSSIGHSPHRDTKTDRQGPTPLYSTALLAWKALRNELEIKFANELVGVDERIEQLQEITRKLGSAAT